MLFFLLIFLFFSPAQAKSPSGKEVEKIFKAKCMDCHSDQTVYPWYASLPVAKELIEADIQKGKAFFDLPRDFFAYEEDNQIPKNIINAIEAQIKYDRMPPIQYRAAHWDRIISAEEKQKILTWITKLNDSLFEPLPEKTSLNLDTKKITLGEVLYHDKRLSDDNTLSCSSCHDLKKGGTDQKPVSTGIKGQQGPINSPTVYNSSYNVKQFWDGRAETLEAQAHGPVSNPIEMGSNWPQVIKKLQIDKGLTKKFEEIYGTQKITGDMIANSIAEYEKSLITPNSPFDKFLKGDKNALNPDQQRGFELFKKYNCSTCHFGPTVGGQVFRKMGITMDYFADRSRGANGLTAMAVHREDFGRFNVTLKDTDKYVFKVPILRNIELTYPYFHDGNVATLEEAVRIMGEYQSGYKLSKDEISSIVAFLKSLTSEDLR